MNLKNMKNNLVVEDMYNITTIIHRLPSYDIKKTNFRYKMYYN